MKLTVTLSVSDIAQALLRHLKAMGAQVDENSEASVVFEYDAENQLTGATLAVESFNPPVAPVPATMEARQPASVEPYKPSKAAKPKPPRPPQEPEMSPEDDAALMADLAAQSRALEKELASEEPEEEEEPEPSSKGGGSKPYVMNLGRHKAFFLGEGRALGVEPPLER